MNNLSINLVKHKTDIDGQIEYTLSLKMGARTSSMSLYSTDSTEEVLDTFQTLIDSFRDEVIDTCLKRAITAN